MIQAVLLDLFKTLVSINHNREFVPYLKKTALDLDINVRRISLENIDILEKIERAQVTTLDMSMLQKILEKELASIKWYDDSVFFLKELKNRGVKIGIISNLTKNHKDAVERMLDLSAFADTAIYSCDQGISKPNPEMFKLALRMLNVKRENAIMIGDSYEVDVKGARNVHIKARLIQREVKKEHRLIGAVASLGSLLQEPSFANHLI